MKLGIIAAALVVMSTHAFGSARLAVSVNHFCTLGDKEAGMPQSTTPTDEKAAFCWDGSGKLQNIPFALNNPTAIVAGARVGGERGDYSAAISNGEVRFWGKVTRMVNNLTEKFKDFKHASLLAAGSMDVCAYDDEIGLRCEGGPKPLRWTKISEDYVKHKRERFIAIDVGTFYACGVTHQKQILCWGGPQDFYLNKIVAEPLKSELAAPNNFLTSEIPRLEPDGSAEEDNISISVGLQHACVTARSKATCWGISRAGETEFKEVPADFADASIYRTCISNKGNFTCRGVLDNNLKSMIQNAQNFALSVVGNKEEWADDRNTCLATDKAISCFGKINTSVNINMVGMSLAQLEQEYTRMSYYAYKEKADVMDRAAQLITHIGTSDDAQKRDARLFVLVGLRGLVTNIDSPYFEKNIRGRYDYMYEVYGNQYRAKSLDNFKGVQQIGWVAMELLDATLSAVQAHIVLDSETSSLADFLKVLRREKPKAEVAKGADYTGVGAMGKKSLAELVGRMSQHPRYRGIALTVDSLCEFLANF